MSILSIALGFSLLYAADLYSETYPAAQGFDTAGSSPQAIALAEETMQAMGGYPAWSQTRFITWRFFGRRLHVWDKWTGDIRFEQDDLTVLMNIHTKRGRAFRDGNRLTDSELQTALDQGYRAWINDSYWLVMPYKLKDSGVTLLYSGKGKSEDGRDADVLELRFTDVGVTPNNKYRVWIDRESHLVSQWAFYADAEDAEPRFIGPWQNWQRHGRIMLSDNRGQRSHTDVAVLSELPASVLSDPSPLDKNVLRTLK
jgi:hypothetical protein